MFKTLISRIRRAFGYPRGAVADTARTEYIILVEAPVLFYPHEDQSPEAVAYRARMLAAHQSHVVMILAGLGRATGHVSSTDSTDGVTTRIIVPATGRTDILRVVDTVNHHFRLGFMDGINVPVARVDLEPSVAHIPAL